MAASQEFDYHSGGHHSDGTHRPSRRRSSSHRKRRKSSYLRQNALVLGSLTAVALVLLALIVFIEYQQRKHVEPTIVAENPEEKILPAPAIKKRATPVPTTRVPQKAAPLPTPVIKPKPTPRPVQHDGEFFAAIVIDDIGLKRDLDIEFVNLNAEIAFSVLPRMPFSQEMARYVHEKGLVVMAHLPMEPHKSEAMSSLLPWLRVGMKKHEFHAILDQILAENPYAVGANNHTGSRFSVSEPDVAIVLDYLKKKGLFYLDSRTTPETLAYRMALQRGIPTAERNVFFDDEDTREAISMQCERFIELALRNGHVIGIGHPRESTLQVLREYLPRFREANITLVPITSLLEPPQ